jgi:hypothetical protein
VGVTRDEERYFAFDISPIEYDYFLCGCSQKVSCLEAKAKRGTGNLSHKHIALLKPLHVPQVHFFGRDTPVRLPSAVLDQMPCQHFVVHLLKDAYNFPGRHHGRAVSRYGKPKIDFHARGIILAKLYCAISIVSELPVRIAITSHMPTSRY